MNNLPASNQSEPKNEIVVYQPDETVRLDVRLEENTVWLTQNQMTDLFQRDRSVITRHINNVFTEGELDEQSNVHFLHIAISDKPVKMYSLNVIISVGYRVKSFRGTQFRIWATGVLKELRYRLESSILQAMVFPPLCHCRRRIKAHISSKISLSSSK